jgi:type II secretory pathway component PulF
VGELSGKLEKAFDRISDDTGASMEAKLNFMQPLLVRIVMFAVVMSIIGTMLSLIV